jgi:four helix bundle protein
MQRFTELDVWGRGHQLLVNIHRLTASFPSDEPEDLKSQLRQQAALITTNILAGLYSDSWREHVSSLETAARSAVNAHFFLHLAGQLHLAPVEDLEPLRSEAMAIMNMVSRLRARLEDALCSSSPTPTTAA